MQVDEGDTVTITITFSGITNGAVNWGAVTFSGTATAGEDYPFLQSGDRRFAAFPGRQIQAGDASLSFSQTYSITDDDATEDPEPDETIIVAVPMVTTFITTDTFTATDGPITIFIRANDGYVDPTADDPVAREMRLEALAAAVARGVGQLASQAVVGRLTASVAAGNTFNLGRAATVDDLLRGSSFSLAGNNGGRGFNFWGGGSYVSADGEYDGVSYDGDTTSFHVGIDTTWRDGLIGVAVGTSDGDTDFTVTADGMKSTLETDVTSVHPYLTRKFGGSQLWLTAGHGSGDAELKEPGTVIKTDVTVTTAAFGVSHARGDVFTGGLSALYSRAKLDAATGTGKMLPATTADGLRITADAEVGKRIGNLRPFALFAFRHDSGDGDTGGAADLGGGLEYRTPTVLVRLEGSGHIQGQGADESRVSLTARKSSGRLSLGLNLAADETGLDTARLLHGEWRF